jgi:hypothetical protein
VEHDRAAARIPGVVDRERTAVLRRDRQYVQWRQL